MFKLGDIAVSRKLMLLLSLALVGFIALLLISASALHRNLMGEREARLQAVLEDNYADLDIVSLGKHYSSEGYVLTSEQKTPNINWDRPNAHKGIKVPNLAEKFGVKCGSWINLINELDISD